MSFGLADRVGRRRRGAGLITALALLWLVSACFPGGSPGGRQEGTPTSVVSPSESSPPSPTETPVAVFFAREGKLEAVFRSLAVAPQDAPAAALAALIAGPTAAEGRQGFGPVLPAAARVLGVVIGDGTATADLSREVITRSGEVGASSTAEALALHAIYLTLAQFPGVERVRVLVEGQSKGTVDGRAIEDFWGHVGLPQQLAGYVPVLKVVSRQEVGEPADGLRLKSVRWWAHPALFRLVFDVDRQDGPLDQVPATQGSYSPSSRVLSLTINGIRSVAAEGLSPGQSLEINDWRAATLTWRRTEDDQAVSFALALQPDRAYGWRLWSLTEPVRIVVDVYAAGSAFR